VYVCMCVCVYGVACNGVMAHRVRVKQCYDL
jgi:hypothetical protein